MFLQEGGVSIQSLSIIDGEVNVTYFVTVPGDYESIITIVQPSIADLESRRRAPNSEKSSCCKEGRRKEGCREKTSKPTSHLE